MDLKLTEHFMLSEFSNSCTAMKYGINNEIPSQFIPRVAQLCTICLEPLRKYAGIPINISSGYRSALLNLKIGGVPASQHTLGEAADIVIPKNNYTDWDDNKAHTNMDIANRWFNFLTEHTDYDQCILETSNGRDYWIHISCKGNQSRNRHQSFRNMHKKL